jgi:hypothetical protein
VAWGTAWSSRTRGRLVYVRQIFDTWSRNEHDANELAKAFTISERVAMARAIEEEIHAQGERRGR